MENLKEAISKLNHDLRNSLSVIYSNSQLLELLTEKSNKEAHATAKQLSQSIQDMEALLADRIRTIRETL